MDGRRERGRNSYFFRLFPLPFSLPQQPSSCRDPVPQQLFSGGPLNTDRTYSSPISAPYVFPYPADECRSPRAGTAGGSSPRRRRRRRRGRRRCAWPGRAPSPARWGSGRTAPGGGSSTRRRRHPRRPPSEGCPGGSRRLQRPRLPGSLRPRPSPRWSTFDSHSPRMRAPQQPRLLPLQSPEELLPPRLRRRRRRRLPALCLRQGEGLS